MEKLFQIPIENLLKTLSGIVSVNQVHMPVANSVFNLV